MAQIQVEQINSSPGIFFNKLGNAKISNKKITLIHYINTTIFDETLNIAEKYYYKSTSICTLVPKNHSNAATCNFQLKLLDQQIQEIKTLIKNVKLHHRNKRGLINAGSVALKWLIGTPDSDDALFYTNSINSLIDERKTQAFLMKDQVKIIGETLRIYNTTIRQVQAAENLLNYNLNTFNEYLSNYSLIVNQNSIELEILDHLLLIKQLNDMNLQKLQQYSLTLTLIRHNIIDYEVINPFVLINELLEIPQVNLPFSVDTQNIENFYKIINAKSFISDETLVIIIRIPVVSPIDYQIFQIFPLPVIHPKTNILTFIKPNYQYLIASMGNLQFAPLKNLEKYCKLINQIYVCNNINTLDRNPAKICEIQIFDPSDDKIPESCTLTRIPAQAEIWQPLQTNKWIFVLNKPIRGNLICNEIETTIKLHGTGTIQLDNNCTLKTHNTILETTQEILIKKLQIKIPQINITSNIDFKPALKFKPLETIKVVDLNMEDLDFTQHKLNELQETLQSRINEPFVIKYENVILKWLGYSAILLIISTIMYYIYQYGIAHLISHYLGTCCNCLLPCKNRNKLDIYYVIFKKQPQVTPPEEILNIQFQSTVQEEQPMIHVMDTNHYKVPKVQPTQQQMKLKNIQL